jgi:cell wall-associated NlpC family hydrolase
MSTSFPARSAILVAAVFVLIGSSPFASAQTRHRHRIYQGRVVHLSRSSYVPLQPFTLHTTEMNSRSVMTTAYYAPHAIPRASQIDREEDDSDASAPVISGRGPTVAGSRAVLRNGVAYAPSDAPANVKSAIWAVNTIRSKPYHWGGGHGSFSDSGYDCSGTVSFALHHAGVLNQPLPSSDLLRFGERGRGRWITIYSRRGHTFATIAGLRLDTTDFRYGGNVGPRWHTDGRETWGFEARHPIGL